MQVTMAMILNSFQEIPLQLDSVATGFEEMPNLHCIDV